MGGCNGFVAQVVIKKNLLGGCVWALARSKSSPIYSCTNSMRKQSPFYTPIPLPPIRERHVPESNLEGREDHTPSNRIYNNQPSLA